MEFPGARPIVVVGTLLRGLLVALAEMIVEPDPEAIEVVLRIVAGGRCERKARQAEICIEIFEPRRPAAAERVVDAAAQRISRAQLAGRGILVAGRGIGA